VEVRASRPTAEQNLPVPFNAIAIRLASMTRRIMLVTMAFAMIAWAVDINGKWKGPIEGPNGRVERTFTFRVDGTKLTGETESPRLGKSAIEDGKVEGDDISFNIKASFQGSEVKRTYKGKIIGDTIRLRVEIGGDGGLPVEITLRKVP
jgi:hypothetical protein